MTARNEVKALRAWTKFPGSDKLRKGASAELRRMLADGWHEVGRNSGADHIVIRLERPIAAQPHIPRRREEAGDAGGGGDGGGRGGGERGGGNRGGGDRGNRGGGDRGGGRR